MMKPVTERDIDMAVACTFPASDPIALHCEPEDPLDTCQQSATAPARQDATDRSLAPDARLVDMLRPTISTAKRLPAKAARPALPGRHAEGSAPAPGDAAAAGEILTDVVKARAFELFQQRERDGLPGDAASDWARAEQDLGDRSHSRD